MAALEEKIFLEWTQVILDRIDKLREAQPEKRKILYDDDGFPLWDNFDLCQELHVSMRTLQRYRDSGTLPYQMLYYKTFYKESDVRNFIRNHFLNFKKRKSKI